MWRNSTVAKEAESRSRIIGNGTSLPKRRSVPVNLLRQSRRVFYDESDYADATHQDIDRAFGLAENRFRGTLGQELGWVPRIEMRQSGNNLVIHAELPGLSEKDVRLEATDEGLLIEGERTRQQETDEGAWRHSEFSYGRFSKAIPLRRTRKSTKLERISGTEFWKQRCPCRKQKINAGRYPLELQGKHKAPGQARNKSLFNRGRVASGIGGAVRNVGKPVDHGPCSLASAAHCSLSGHLPIGQKVSL